MINILETKNLKKDYIKYGKNFTVIEDINIEIAYGQCVGLVGESGSGKSTIAKLITGIEKATSGKIIIEGQDITNYSRKEKKNLYKTVQMIFQNPTASFDPRMKLGKSVEETIINFGCRRKDAKDKVLQLFESVGLKEEYFDRYPSGVSGGECQRAAIARAVSVNPKLLVCDEATSSLDVSVQAQIIKLLKTMQKKISLSLLFICHDIALVYNVCDKIYVIHNGLIVESGTCDEVINRPSNPYTKFLIRSMDADYNMDYI